MIVKPLHDNVLVKPIAEEEFTKSGIVLPETVDKEKPERGEIIEVGPGKILKNGERTSMSVKKGDIVIFKKYSPEEINIDSKEYLIINESDILAVLEK